MKYVSYSDGFSGVSEIALGTMRLAGKDESEVEELLMSAIHSGINVIDTSPLYVKGHSEELIGSFLENHKNLRSKIYIQTKCGVEQGEFIRYFDCSKENILKSVDQSLMRMKTDYIDCLLLHKPDQLADPEEIASAFHLLKKQGKVRHFGVSNYSKEQLQLLEQHCEMPIVVNQLKLSISNTRLIDGPFLVNTIYEQANDRSSGVLDYMRMKGIVLQAFSVVRSNRPGETFINNPHHEKLNAVMDRLCQKYSTNKNAIALAWVLRHPAQKQAVIGTGNPSRIDQYLDAYRFQLTKEEWYELYTAEGKPMP